MCFSGADAALNACKRGMAMHCRGSGSNSHSFWVVHQDDLHIRAFWVQMDWMHDFREPEAFPDGVGEPEHLVV